jgi:uncharacterized damage-inducible protein DinB
MNISPLYEKDINKLIKEISLYENEEDIWKLEGAILNTAGNLALHLTGSLNYFIGNILGQTGYVRERDKEFSLKDIPQEKLLEELQKMKEIVVNTLSQLTEEDLQKDFPLEINSQTMSTADTLVFFLAHLNYHLGQVNYHRRIIAEK